MNYFVDIFAPLMVFLLFVALNYIILGFFIRFYFKKLVNKINEYNIDYKKIEKINNLDFKSNNDIKKVLNDILEKKYAVIGFSEDYEEFIYNYLRLKFWKFYKFLFLTIFKIRAYKIKLEKKIKVINEYFTFDDFLQSDFLELKGIYNKLDQEIEKYGLSQSLCSRELSLKGKRLNNMFNDTLNKIQVGDYKNLKSKMLDICRELESYISLIPILYISIQYTSIINNNIENWLINKESKYINSNHANIIRMKINNYNDKIYDGIKYLKENNLKLTIKDFDLLYKELRDIIKLNESARNNVLNNITKVQYIWETTNYYYEEIINILNGELKDIIFKSVKEKIFSELNNISNELSKYMKKITIYDKSSNKEKIFIHKEKALFFFLELANIFIDKLANIFSYLAEIKRYYYLIPATISTLKEQIFSFLNLSVKLKYNIRLCVDDVTKWNIELNNLYKEYINKNIFLFKKIYKLVINIQIEVNKAYYGIIKYNENIKNLEKKILFLSSIKYNLDNNDVKKENIDRAIYFFNKKDFKNSQDLTQKINIS